MAVKRRRMGWRAGDEALADLNEDLRETMGLIKDEEGFAAETGLSPKSTGAMEADFPALKAVR